MTSTTVRIGGMPFTITRKDTELEVCHKGSGQKLWGQIDYSAHSIHILKGCPERELRSSIHEILHGIINEYQVRELMNEERTHLEEPIDQLSLGLAEVLESIGITTLEKKK